jgi:hypothetical protein
VAEVANPTGAAQTAGTVLVGGIDAGTDDLEVGVSVDDRGEDLDAHRAGAPCDDPMMRCVIHAGIRPRLTP